MSTASKLAPPTPTLPLPRVPTVVIAPSRGLTSLQLDRLWQYRELLYFMIWRDVKVRYKQTVLGVAWVALQPLLTVLIFTLLFGLLLKVPSGDTPYPVFALSGVIVWQYFTGSLSRVSTSLVNSAHLITKVYFPRLIIPLAGSLSGLVDFCVGLCLMLVTMIVYGVWPDTTMALLPGFLILAMITALGFGLWLAALNVRYRDVNHLIPFVVQTWMYVTPIAYGSSLIPERFRWVLGLNPMTGVVEGFRWTLLRQQPPGDLFALSVCISVIVLVTGVVYFQRTERQFADII